MRDESIGRHPPFIAYSKETSGSYWTSATVLNFRHTKTLFIFFFCKQDSLLTATDYLLNR